jgi:hypothetical protein
VRALHEEMDRAVLAEYGWDVEVPPYTSPVTAGASKKKKGKAWKKKGGGVHEGQGGLFG